MGNLSILVISKTARLLSELLQSIPKAVEGFKGDTEVLCSWNGSSDEENKVVAPSEVKLYFSQRKPYHFASNCNQLAKQACGDLLLFINDDITLLPGSISEAVNSLEANENCGIIGAKLINAMGSIGHAGILFDHDYKPFHRYLDCPVDHPIAERTEKVPAVTGAFMLTRARDYEKCPMNESYISNGEDIELCLAFKLNLDLDTYYCHRAVGIHPERSTRGTKNLDTGFGNDNSEDLAKIRKVRKHYLASLSIFDATHEFSLSNKEVTWCHHKINELKDENAKLSIEALIEKNHHETAKNAEYEINKAIELELAAKAREEKIFQARTALEKARLNAQRDIDTARGLSDQARDRCKSP